MLHNIRDSQTIFTWFWPVILNHIKRIHKLAKHFTEQKNYFYQYLFFEPQKKRTAKYHKVRYLLHLPRFYDICYSEGH